MKWDTVIGLEVHAQLNTNSKLFSGAATRFGAAPNTATSYIDAGLPGVLPVLNQEAVVKAIQFGLSIDAEINDLSYFERKNYFYPDLPKGYQISQFQRPLVSNGHIEIDLGEAGSKRVEIVRAHLEEDAGKSMHDQHADCSRVDLNRAGTPLLEIVTAPCLASAQEAVLYLKALHQLVRFLNISDGNMQEGSFRCDVNISLKPAGSTQLGVRTEIKNLNSFRFIEQAIHYEQHRHQQLLTAGKSIVQETRLFNPDTQTTQVMRSKENENDYRYFPDPDLLPIHVSAQQIETIKNHLPPHPQTIYKELTQSRTLTDDDIQFLLSTPATYHYFQSVKKDSIADEKTIINWLRGVYMALLNERNQSFENPPVSAETLSVLLDKLHQKSLSHHSAKQQFTRLFKGECSINEIMALPDQQAGSQDDQLEPLIQAVIQQHPQQAQEYRAGKEKLLAFFVGQIMKQTQGQANPEQVSTLIKKLLG